MTRFGNFKKSIFIISLISVLAIMLVLGIYKGENSFKLNTAQNDVSYAYSMSCDNWTQVVYKNAPSFKETEIIGTDAFYYALEEDENGSYSMQAELVSPKFDIYENKYSLTLSYFTRQRSSLPASISIMTSIDGVNYTEKSNIVCFDNNIPVDTWSTISTNISGKFSYLKFVITVYYSKHNGSLIEHGGLYLAKDFTLNSVKNGDLKSYVFTAGITQTEDLVYNGKEQYPEVGISSDCKFPYYTKFVAEQDGVVVSPINVGTYRLFTEIYDNSNELCFRIDSGTYEIKKQKIVSVENVKTLANIDYVVIFDAEIIDAEGNYVDFEKLNGDFIYDATSSITATFASDNYEEFVLDLGMVNPNTEIDWMIYVAEKEVTTEYNGEVKSVSDNVKIFTEYDFESGEFTYETGAVAIRYYMGEEELQPIDAGFYTYEITYGNTELSGTLTIEPKTLYRAEYVGERSLDKTFDGTAMVAVDGILNNEFADGDFVIEGFDNPELKLCYDAVKYERTTGKPYLIFDNAYFSGIGADNYAFADDFYVKADTKISAVSLMWENFTDKNGTELEIEDKIYDATTELKILNSMGAEPSLVGLGDGKVTFGDITANADFAYCGKRKVSFSINNERLYNRYLPQIFTGEDVFCNIVRRGLTAEVTEATNTDKEYDMSAESDITVNKIKVVFGETQIDLNDGIKELLDAGSYYVDYESAVYENANSGTDKTITISGAKLLGYDSISEKILSNYKLEEMTYKGNIIAKEIEIITDYIIIKTGEALPEIKTNGFDSDVEFITSIYVNEIEAEMGEGTVIPNKDIAKGEYFVRVACDENGNYSLTDGKFYTVIPLTVTAPTETRDQIIVSQELNDFNKFVIFCGGSYKMDFISATTYGKNTGLGLQYEADSDCISITSDGTIKGLSVGETQVTVSQRGNEYYNEAESVTFTVEVKDAEFYTEVNGYETVLYNGDSLPTDINDYTNILLNGSKTSGNLVPTENIVTTGTNVYKYVFSFPESFVLAEFDYTLDKELYEKNENVYIRTSDTNYVNGKTYYIVEFEEDVTVVPGNELALSGNIYYEYTEGYGYTITSDTEFRREKSYYLVKGAMVDETFVIIGDFYVSDGNGGYVLTEDTHFADGTDYYYEGKQYYGETEIDIELTALPIDMELTLGGTVTMSYGESPILGNLINSISIAGETVPFVKYRDMFVNDLFTLYLISYDENGELVKTDVTYDKNPCGTYTVFAENDEEGMLVLEITGECEYNVTLKGSASCVIEKSVVVLEIVNMEKYYYENVPTNEEFLSEMKIMGTVADGDEDKIKQSAVVSVNITPTTTVGEYEVKLRGNGDEFENYIVIYNSGFITVRPMPIIVTTTSRGHVFKEDLANIDINAVSQIGGLDSDEKNKINDYIRENTTAWADVEKDSDVGEYPINVVYNGKDKNFIITFIAGKYVITPAVITGMTFEDKNVLYDGSRHSLSVSYDENEWPDVEIVYDNYYFVEEGIYTFTAKINNKNYKELVLTAKLTIGTVTISSSSLINNFVSVKINDESCTEGVNPNLTTKLIYKESTDSLIKKLESVYSVEKYKVLGVYDIEVYLVSSKKTLDYENYTVTINPEAVKYNSNIKLFGYGTDGQYKELKFEYDSGKYTVNTSSLKDFIFVIEETTEQNPIVTWILIVGFVLLILLVLCIISSGRKRSKKDKRISRRRHHRWV